jgi:putative addiction module CopG family antidote
MVTMSISLPDNLKLLVEQEVAEGDFVSASDFVRDVIRNHLETKKYKRYLIQSINDGLDSAASDYSRQEMLEKMRASVA